LARFVALLWGTEAMPVPGEAGCWIAFADAEGRSMVMVEKAHLPRPEARLAVSTRRSETAVHALAANEGWRSRHVRRVGDTSAVAHAAVEGAVEAFLVLEVLPEAVAADRAEAMRPWRWGAILAGLIACREAAERSMPAVPPMSLPVPRAA
jgi:hypothetical protein